MQSEMCDSKQLECTVTKETLQIDDHTSIQLVRSPVYPSHYKSGNQRIPSGNPKDGIWMPMLSVGDKQGHSRYGKFSRTVVTIARVTHDHWALMARTTVRGVPSVFFELFDFAEDDSNQRQGKGWMRYSPAFGVFKVPAPNVNFTVLPGYWYTGSESKTARVLRWGILVGDKYVHLLENDNVKWSMLIEHGAEHAQIFTDGQVLIGTDTHEWPCATEHGQWTMLTPLDRRLFTTIEEDTQ